MTVDHPHFLLLFVNVILRTSSVGIVPSHKKQPMALVARFKVCKRELDHTLGIAHDLRAPARLMTKLVCPLTFDRP